MFVCYLDKRSQILVFVSNIIWSSVISLYLLGSIVNLTANSRLQNVPILFFLVNTMYIFCLSCEGRRDNRYSPPTFV